MIKKYLIAGAMVSVLGGFFASCQHDEIYGSIVEAKVEAYKEVFKEEFGTIDSNQDWGFGTNAHSRASVSRTRAIAATHVFATAPATSDYKTDVPEGVPALADLTDPWGGHQTYHIIEENGSYAISSSDSDLKFDRYAVNVYVVGTIDNKQIANGLYLHSNSTLYLTAGSKLILDEYSFGQSNVRIYVAPGATLECTGKLQISTSLLYNAGTVKAGSLQVAGTGKVYNQGTIELTGEISVENNDSEIVNDGTITATRLHTAGSGHVQNNGDVTLSGNTDIDSNNNTWVNNGHYRTQYFNYIAGSNDVINNCFLTVDEDFNINHADNAGDFGFRMDTGAGVLTKNFYGGATKENKPGSGPFYITMGSGSVFKVTNDAYMNATRPNYGIYGPSTGDVYAVFQAKNIKTSNPQQRYDVTYSGKLAIVAETHFDSENGFEGNDGDAVNGPIIGFANSCTKNNIYVGNNVPNISIAASTCNPGFGAITIPIDDSTTGKVKVETTVETFTETQLVEQGRVFCEDLGTRSSNDVDFNDVVFDAYIYKVNTGTKTTIKKNGVFFSENVETTGTSYYANIILLAAGGTYPLTVAGTEIHTALGATSTSVIVNTCSSDEDAYSNPYINTTSAKDLGNIPDITSIKAIPIIVKIGDEVHELTAEQGEAAEKICIEKIGTKWTKERKKIKFAYDFQSYVNDASKKFWDNILDESLLYTCSWDTYTNRSTEIVSETKSSTTVETEEDGATTGGYDNGPVLTRRNH